MGNRYSSTSNLSLLQPEEIGTFRKSNSLGSNYYIPEAPQKRQVTDRAYLWMLGICLCLLVPLLIYTFSQWDVNRLTHGYDSCGNVCGEKNEKIASIPCSGVDYSNDPYLNIGKETHHGNIVLVGKNCTDRCINGDLVFNRCLPKGNESFSDDVGTKAWMMKVSRDLRASATTIVLMCLMGIVLCGSALMLFRYQTKVFVWFILIVSMAILISWTAFTWYLNIRARTEEAKKNTQTIAIGLTVITSIMLLLLICLIKRINLVIRIMRESIRVIFEIPLILAQPLLTSLAFVILFASFGFTLLVIQSAGTLEPAIDGFNSYDYMANGYVLFTLFFDIVIVMWLFQFIIGCQHMVISGAVASVYFNRPEALTSPIYLSFYNTVRFHLGTVAFGSLILTIAAITRAIIRAICSNRWLRCLADFCLGYIEAILTYLSKNAYILTAIHGQPFMRSGRRAVHLLTTNLLSAVAVNSVGDYVMGVTKVLIVLVTLSFGVLLKPHDIEHFWPALTIAGVFTLLMTVCVFQVFETAVDTLFLCYCEDSCLNDGSAEHPYYMSTNLKLYMDEAKSVYNKN